jgi:Mn2+/Fe2+ NRAMP family transporter
MLANLRKRLAFVLLVLGPGMITANVDNDANGIATYSTAGSQFGYKMLWLLLVITFFQIIVQDMCARMGCVTGKGLADLIRERFGVRITLGVMLVLFVANMANTVGDFAGLAEGFRIFGVPPWISVPAGIVFMGLLILGASYERVEKVFLAACLIYLTYIFSGLLAHPDWHEVGHALTHPVFPLDIEYVSLAVGVVGTTIAPWMQFFQQSATRDKGMTINEYKYAWLDVVAGTLVMVAVGGFIIVACAATLHKQGLKVETAQDAARALAPLAGHHASMLFAVGLINAALFSVSIIPLSTSYAICEAFGWESGVGLDFREAPTFFSIYGFMLIVGGLLVMIPGLPLIKLMIFSQIINGALLPVILICMLILINDRKVMGDWVNSKLYNGVAWGSTIAVIGMAAAMVVLTIKTSF